MTVQKPVKKLEDEPAISGAWCHLAVPELDQATVDTIEAESKRKVEAATEACKASPPAPVELLTKDVYADGGWAWRN